MTTRFVIKGNATLKCTVCGKRLGETAWECEVAVNSPIRVHPWAQVSMLHHQEANCGLRAVAAQMPVFHIEEMH